MTLRETGRGYLPLLLSFAAPQLILQTDLMMVSALGAEATAAQVVPLRVALLDAVLMMALGSVTSVLVAAAVREGRVAQVAYGVLTVAVVLGILVAATGVVVYPRAVYWLTDDPAIARLAADALIWYALAAPFRFVASVAVMALHALGDGRAVLRWKLAEVGFNALLDALFIFTLGFGFVGAYLATFGVLVAGSLWALVKLVSRLNASLHLPRLAWVGAFLRQSGWETKRVLSAQLFALTAMVLFATALITPPEIARLGAYSAGSALALLLFMPSLALFRFLAFRLSGMPPKEVLAVLARLAGVGLPLLLLVTMALLMGGEALGQHLYGLSSSWWTAAAALIALALPVRYINSLQRGALHAGGHFAQVALVDGAVLWGIGLPSIITGLHLDSPFIAFSFLLLPELGALPLLWRLLRPALAATDNESILYNQNNKEYSQ